MDLFKIIDPLVKEILKANEAIRSTPAYFLIKSTVTRMNLEFHNGYAWPVALVHLASTVQYLGGKRSLQLWNGSQVGYGSNQGGIHLISQSTNLALPSYSTVKKHLTRAAPYQSISAQALPHITSFLKAYRPSSTLSDKIHVFFAMDEISLRSGLLQSKYYGAIGLVDGPLTTETLEALKKKYGDTLEKFRVDFLQSS